ncbi:hypothetical protein AMATHDRAFT_57146 [Amanita thiersii Skay4041]|uniref:Uncharacterized protein n=1 Tax=Amanita thiersii Skay4041 TaxID=703135 RepID=A0A2A9NWV5_9AGAR|nr:hypothetical protein AMATHDRAFT_57146 [Amanita thiersii Skay4041]
MPTSDTSAFASQSGPPVYVPARTSPKLVIHRPRVDPPPIEYLSKDEVQDTICSPTRERDTFNPLQDVHHKQRTTALGMKAPSPESLVQNNDGRETYTKVCSGESARPAQMYMESAHHERDHHNLNCIQNTPNWLLNIEVMVSIDQEGFRSVIPAFKFIGISPRILEGGNPASRDLARFLPATKQVFQFHYAPFDGLPILRRITTEIEWHIHIKTLRSYTGNLYIV